MLVPNNVVIVYLISYINQNSKRCLPRKYDFLSINVSTPFNNCETKAKYDPCCALNI